MRNSFEINCGFLPTASRLLARALCTVVLLAMLLLLALRCWGLDARRLTRVPGAFSDDPDVDDLAFAIESTDGAAFDRAIGRRQLIVRMPGREALLPLLRAVRANWTYACRRLLEHHADPNCRDLLGDLPLHYAVRTDAPPELPVSERPGCNALQLEPQNGGIELLSSGRGETGVTPGPARRNARQPSSGSVRTPRAESPVRRCYGPVLDCGGESRKR